MTKSVVFRVDASAVIGGGHIVRCLALADAFRRDGAHITIVCDRDTIPFLTRYSAGIDRRVLVPDQQRTDATVLIGALPVGCDLLVIDHYSLDRRYEALLDGWAKKILVIDDLANRPHQCQFLVDSALGRNPAEYYPWVGSDTRCLCGPSYALLRPGFAHHRRLALARRKARPPLRRVLISFGMCDPQDYTSVALRALANLSRNLEIDILLGSTAPHLDILRTSINSFNLSVALHVDLADPSELMAQADIAIGASGSTSWERCSVGLPSAVLVAAENQRNISDHLAEAGTVILIEEKPANLPQAIEITMRRLLFDCRTTYEMAESAALICDGLGCRRVATDVFPETTQSGHSVTLRPVCAADADIIFEWQQIPGLRRHFRNSRPPSRAEHDQWMASRLRDTNCLHNLIVSDGIPAGVLRLDRELDQKSEEDTYEVSIFLAPDFQGKGLGSAALRSARRLVPDARLAAHVSSDNISSRALFHAAGFRSNGEEHFVLEAARA